MSNVKKAKKPKSFMHPIIKILFRISAIFLVLFLATKPYNFFCNLSNSCEPFYFSYLIPKKEGTLPITVNFEVTNYTEGLDFEAITPTIKTVAGRKNSMTYLVKNNTDHTIKFRPDFNVDPDKLFEYVTPYQCLCEKSYQVKSGETLKLKMTFLIEPEIEKAKQPDFDLELKIRYKI